MKKVSIIMPSLNVKPYISECLESVINQTLNDIEMLCIDAGSTDGTLEIIEKYAKKDSRIKLIQFDIKSYGAQVNQGIKIADGKYIAILETDDYVSLDMYEKLYNIAEREQVDYVKADFRSFYTLSSGDRLYNDIKLFDDKSSFYNKIINPHQQDDLYKLDFNIWKGIYNKAFLQKNNIILNESNGAAYQDIGFMEQVLCYARKAYYSNEVYYHYRTDRDEASTYSPNVLKNTWVEFENLYEFVNNKKNSVYLKGYYIHMATAFCVEYRKTINHTQNIDENKKYYEWFKEKINYALKYQIISVGDFKEEIKNELTLLLGDEKNYCEFIIASNKEKDKCLKLLEEQSDKVVFGAGYWGKQVLKYFDKYKREKEILAFADNDKNKHGCYIGGKKIYDIIECITLYPNAIYIIANAKHSKEIVFQLKKLGIRDNQIIHFS